MLIQGFPLSDSYALHPAIQSEERECTIFIIIKQFVTLAVYLSLKKQHRKMWKPHEMQRNVSQYVISREMHKVNILDVNFCFLQKILLSV